MIYKKNLLSYCLWILYTVAAAMGLFALAAYVCLKMGYPAWSGFAASLCLLLAEAFACAFFHALNKRRGIKSREDSDKYRLWLSVAEGLTVTVILGILLTMRIISLSAASRQSALFEEAMVKSGGIIEPSFRISDYLYIRAVNLVCVVFGNKITAVYIFQIVLQLLAFVMIYFAVRRLSGVLPAVCSVLFPGIITNFNSTATDLSTAVMLFFMFALGLLVVSGCFGRSAKGFKLLYCISGVYTGF
ncbi:MAG: glycosyltransferase family 39 protein, partial [Lachnospiraceae bacterium]|nr:glycosyltransferase family 39 protein [Lachnospiraceae bacterium]